MSPFALTLMKFGPLVLLYLFVWRSLKTVASGPPIGPVRRHPCRPHRRRHRRLARPSAGEGSGLPTKSS